MVKKMKSNDLGLLFENNLKEALGKRNCAMFRLHTIRSWKGVHNPCDFIVLDEKFSALFECKATNDDRFSCSQFQQLEDFEIAAKFNHRGIYGLLIYFYSDEPVYVFATDHRVIENKINHRPIRPTNFDSYDLKSNSLDDLLNQIEKIYDFVY